MSIKSFPDYLSPELSCRVDSEIKKHRCSDVSFSILDHAGNPIPFADAEVEQVSSDFLFGGNIFMLEGAKDNKVNDRYEKAFTDLFNAATVPLYWKDLEPEQDNLRFDRNSSFIARRPPVDVVVEFCEENGLNMNGHPLVWNNLTHSIPKWLKGPADVSVLEQRIAPIAEKYGDRIQRWDVVNEASLRHIYPQLEYHPMADDYERMSFELARKYLPESAYMMINEAPGGVWNEENQHHFYGLLEHLKASECKVNGVGMQFHLFNQEGMLKMLNGQTYAPETILGAFNKFSQFGAPLHLSEITMHSLKNDKQGKHAQADLARDFYRLCFSHPAVNAITWWNVPDGGAVPGEASLFSGILDEETNPKPAYETLYNLINKEWRTNVSGKTDADGLFKFNGFHGKYRIKSMGKEFIINNTSDSIQSTPCGTGKASMFNIQL